jgi:RHS repeat-associated protein
MREKGVAMIRRRWGQGARPGGPTVVLRASVFIPLFALFGCGNADPRSYTEDRAEALTVIPTADVAGAILALPQAGPGSPIPGGVAERFDAVPGGLEPDFGAEEDSANARLTLPARSNGAIRVVDAATGAFAEITLRNALAVDGQAANGYVVYRGGLKSGASLFVRATLDGAEDYISFPARPQSPEVAYDVALGAGISGLRLVEGTLEMLDASGTPRLRVTPPYLVDSEGAIVDAALSVSGCAVDTDPAGPWGRPVTVPGASTCQVRATWNDSDVKYPAVLDPRWTTTGSMGVARYEHTLTLLSNGKVLAVGGRSSTGSTAALSSAELYDRTTRTWSPTASMSSARRLHTATQLNTSSNATTSGKVLVAGGVSGSTTVSTFQLYSVSGTWTTAANMNAGRHAHTATLLADGRALLAAGMNGSTTLQTAALYNPASGSGSWAATTGPIPPPGLKNHTATLIQTSNSQLNNKVLLVGGNSGSATVSAVYLFDPAQSAFSTLAPMSSPREQHTAIVLANSNGKILVAGGKNGSSVLDSAIVFDPGSGPGSWSSAGTMKSKRFGHSMTALPNSVVANGQVLVAGGNNGSTTLSSTELLSGTNVWTLTASMPAAMQGHQALLLGDNMMLAAGGLSGSTVLTAAHLYDASFGLGCTSNNQCPTGFCASGVCCNSACDGGCGACNLAGNLGTCSAQPSGTSCRAKSGACDVAEICTGSSANCPTDSFATASTVCRAAAGQCDVPETCTGSGPSCPSDVLASNGTACNDGDLCTTVDACQTGACVGGSPVACAALNQCHLAGTCNPATGVCSNPESGDPASCTDDDAIVRGFENVADWTSSAGTLAASNVTSQGRSSVALANLSGLTEVISRVVRPPYDFDLVASYDIRIPSTQTNPSWYGTTSMYVTCPSANVYDSLLGEAALTGFPREHFRSVQFDVTPGLVSSLRSSCTDLTYKIVLNVPPGNGTYHLDNIRFGASSLDQSATTLADSLVDDALGFEDRSLWTASAGTVVASTNHSDGDHSLQITGIGYTELTSAPLGALSGIGDSIALDVMLPTTQINPSWYGQLDLYLSIPSQGVSNVLVGGKALLGVPLGSFQSISFALSTSLQDALKRSYTDARIKIALSVPPGSPGSYYIDNMRTHEIEPFVDCVVDQNGTKTAYLGYRNPASLTALLTNRFDSVIGEVTGGTVPPSVYSKLKSITLKPVEASVGTTFYSGTQHGILVVRFNGSFLVWKLGRKVLVVSVQQSPTCTVQPPDGTDAVTISIAGGQTIKVYPGGSASLPQAIVDTEVFGTPAPLAMGRTPGKFDVTPDGSASYTVPLWVPDGRNGMQPDLRLVYNSRHGDGLLGQGWSISGLSSIAPCRSTMAQDRKAEPVDFLPSDKLCLDGERLVPLSFSGGFPSEYRTERDPFSRIFPKNLDSNGTPEYFQIFQKDGRILWLGWKANTTDSRLVGTQSTWVASQDDSLPPTRQTRTVTAGWYVSRMQDRAGNALTIIYGQEHENTPDSGHEIWPDTISYTDVYSGDSQTRQGTRSIHFVTENRPDRSEGYIRGFKTQRTRRLSRIEVRGPDPTESGLLRTYEMSYQVSNTGRSLLHFLSECDRKHVCKRPTTFNWEPTGGFTDLLTNISDAMTSGGDRYWSLQMLDLDGDGRDDVLYRAIKPDTADGSTVGWYFRLSNGDGFSARDDTTMFSGKLGRGQVFYDEGLTADIDMNGRGDFIVYGDPIVDTQHPRDDGFRYYDFQNGSFVEHPNYFPWAAHDSFPSLLGDVDGDGLSDQMHQFFDLPAGVPLTWAFVFNIGDFKFTDNQVTTANAATLVSLNYLVDVYGGGRVQGLTRDTKLVGNQFVATGTRYKIISATDRAGGIATETSSLLHPSVSSEFDINWVHVFLDVNGDGLPDAVQIPKAGGNPTTFINTGRGFAPGVTNNLTAHFQPNRPVKFCGDDGRDHKIEPGYRIIDYNQDGRQDLLLLGTDNSGVRSSAVVLQSDGLGHFQGVDLSQVPIGVRPFAGSNGCEDRGYRLSQITDLDGDGVSDIITAVPGGVHVFRRKKEKPDRLTQIVDGLGLSTSIGYSAISGHPARAGGQPLYTPSEACAYPQYCVRRGVDVVASYSVDNPAGTKSNYEYDYVDGRTDLRGRGWLGFAKRIRRDLQTGGNLVSEYDNHVRMTGTVEAYPFAGMLSKENETVTVENGRTLVRARVFTNKVIDGLSASGSLLAPYAVRPTGVTETLSDLSPTGSSDPGGIAFKTIMTQDFDNFGNLTHRHTADLEGNEYDWSVPEGQYLNDTSRWLIGLAKYVVETSTTRTQGTRRRATLYDYYPETGFLRRETRDPTDAPEAFRETTYDRDPIAYGQVTTQTVRDTRDSRVTTITYDAIEAAYPSRVTRPKNLYTDYVFHPGLGVLRLRTDSNSISRRWRYDGFGRIRHQGGMEPSSTEQGADSTAVSYHPPILYPKPGGGFDFHGVDEISISPAGGATQILSYDRFGNEVFRRVSTSDGDSLAETRYDFEGRVVQRSMPYFANAPAFFATHTYDRAGRLKTTTNPAKPGQASSSTNYEYSFRRRDFTDERGRKSYVTQDAAGRVQKSANIAEGGHEIITQYSYAPFGGADRIVDQEGNSTVAIHDPWGRQTSLTDPDSGQRTYHYNGFDELVREVIPGQSAENTYEHDALGRVTKATTEDGVTTYVWDEAKYGRGRISSATSPDGTIVTREYDRTGRSSRSTWTINGGSYSIDHPTDAFGRPGGLTYPNVGSGRLTVGFQYSTLGELSSVKTSDARLTSDPNGLALWTAVHRTAARRVSDETFGNMVTTHRDYDDARGVLTNIRTEGPATNGAVQNVTLDYWPDLDLQRRTDNATGVVETFDYDALDRLTEWKGSGAVGAPWHILYGYDDLGNLKSRTNQLPGVPLPDLVNRYDRTSGGGPHAITSSSLGTYHYDNRGNQDVAPGRLGTTFTAFDLPKAATTATENEVGFLYDAFHSRVAKIQGTISTVYVGNVYERRKDAQGSTTHVFYVPGAESVAVQIQWLETGGGVTSTLRYLHRDSVGSLDSATDAGGSFAGRLRYDPFGQELDPNNLPAIRSQLPSDLRRTFGDHGEDRDLSLLNMGGRLYDPAVGRFISPDPFVVLPEFGQSYNRYAYALNNPLRYGDPTGFEPAAVLSHSYQPPIVPPPPPPESSGEPSGVSTPTRSDQFRPDGFVYIAPNSIGDDSGTALSERTQSMAAPITPAIAPIQPDSGPRDQDPFEMRPTDILPIVGPGYAALEDFKTGHPIWGTLNLGFLVIDIVTLGKASILRNAAVTAGKALLRAEARDVGKSVLESQIRTAAPGIAESVATRGVARPAVTDSKLGNLVKDLYKGASTTDPIGTGSTADAIRHEMATGQAVGGRFHTQKGTEYSRALENWLSRNPNASAADRSAAQSLLDDLRNALGGQ